MTIEQQTPVNVEFSPDVVCATSGELCPARVTLVHLFEESVDPKISDSLPVACRPMTDGLKLNIRLAEYDMVAGKIDCQGPVDGACPSRISMDENQVRRGIVGSLRKIFNREI